MPLLLRRRGAPRLALAMACTPGLLLVLDVAPMPWSRQAHLLPVGTLVWYLLACYEVAREPGVGRSRRPAR